MTHKNLGANAVGWHKPSPVLQTVLQFKLTLQQQKYSDILGVSICCAADVIRAHDTASWRRHCRLRLRIMIRQPRNTSGKKKHAASPTKKIDEILSAVPARMQHLSHRMQPPNDTIETRRVADKGHAPQLSVRDCAMQAAHLFGTRSEEYTINNITPVVCRHAGTRHHQCRKHEDLKHMWPHVSYATNLRISERSHILTTQRDNTPPCAGSKAASDTLPPSDQHRGKETTTHSAHDNTKARDANFARLTRRASRNFCGGVREVDCLTCVCACCSLARRTRT